MLSPLATSALKTIIFFDSQDIPLTLLEIKNYLVAQTGLSEPISLAELESALGIELQSQIHHQDGLFFLAGREKLVDLRRTRYQISLLRFRKARRYLVGLRFIPFLRAVAVSGSQALMSCDTKSDIDLFIITAPRRIWLARTFVSLYFQITGQRRYAAHIANRFCLNHYLSGEAKITRDQNLYTAVEYASLMPALGIAELNKFWQDNQWLSGFLHNPVAQHSNIFFNYEFSPWQKFFEGILDYTIAPILNKLLGFYQKKRIQMQDHILVSDDELSFHPGSRGQTVLARFQAKLTQVHEP